MRFYKVCFVLLFLLVISPQSSFADTWAKTYGGDGFDAPPGSQITSDGGIILAGFTSSFGAVGSDFWVLKLRPDGPMPEELGEIEWEKRYGGPNDEYANYIQETSDGGFIVVGETRSEEYYDFDFWILKLNAAGNVIWQKTYGGSSYDYPSFFNCARATPDGGLIVAGTTQSFSSGGDSDFWILKLDADGNVGPAYPGTWQKTYGLSGSYESATSIYETSDGGFIVVGGTSSSNFGMLVLKLDADGNVIWQKTYGGGAEAIQETSDGGFILAGSLYSAEAGTVDMLVLKTDAYGNIGPAYPGTWQKTYGGSEFYAYANSVQETSDGGFLVAGIIESFEPYSEDGLVLKLNADGTVAWQKTYGGSGGEAVSAQESSSGEMPCEPWELPCEEELIVWIWGRTSSFGAGGWGNVWVLKTTANGEIPGCSAIGDVSVIVSDTSVVGQNANLTTKTSNAIPDDTDVTPQDTGAQISVVCEGEPPDPCADYGGDADGDSICDFFDNCPIDANSNQADSDGDGVGDVCDTCTDTDGDGYGDPGYSANTCTLDNCPNDANKTAPGICGCGTPDIDSDGDGYYQCIDDCNDTDANTYPGASEVCDDGIDNDCDGFIDSSDNDCINVPTPPGEDIVVEPIDPTTGETPVTVTFDNVTGYGTTSVTTSGTGAPPPTGFKLGQPPIYYEILSTATYEGSITICIDYSGTSFTNEDMLRLFHSQDSTWVDVTTSLDTENDIIYGIVDSLSLFAIFQENIAPVVGEIIAPIDPISVGTPITASASFSDSDISDTHTAIWDWDDGTIEAGTVTETGGSGLVENPHTYNLPGVYTITLTVTDNYGGFGFSMYQYVVVYDPDGGFVTGGGWITSPDGAYLPDISLTGKASFGFVSKYKKGTTIPTGNTEFQFKVADLNFHSDTYDWLVIAGAKAQYKGIGTINGEGEYKFILTAIDADINENDSHEIDRFRIKIWTEEVEGVEEIVYDNKLDADINDDNATTEIGGGSIVIHKK